MYGLVSFTFIFFAWRNTRNAYELDVVHWVFGNCIYYFKFETLHYTYHTWWWKNTHPISQLIAK